MKSMRRRTCVLGATWFGSTFWGECIESFLHKWLCNLYEFCIYHLIIQDKGHIVDMCFRQSHFFYYQIWILVIFFFTFSSHFQIVNLIFELNLYLCCFEFMILKKNSVCYMRTELVFRVPRNFKFDSHFMMLQIIVILEARGLGLL